MRLWQLGLVGAFGGGSRLWPAGCQQSPPVVVALDNARGVVLIQQLLLPLPVEGLDEAQDDRGQGVLPGQSPWGQDEGVGLDSSQEKVRFDFPFLLADALHVDLPSVVKGKALVLQDEVGLLRDLDPAADPGAVHPTRQVHGFAPNVVLWFLGADDAGYHGAVADACEGSEGARDERRGRSRRDPPPPSMGFSRQEYWSELPCPPPGDLPDPGIEPTSVVPALAGRVFTTEPPIFVSSYYYEVTI